MTHATPMFELEHHGSIDVLQLAYAGYLGRFRGNTFTQYEYQLGRYFKWCFANDLHPLYDVKRAHVEFYVRHLTDSGLKASTINTSMAPVKGFYDFALWDEYIERDPARRIALPKYSYKKVPIVPPRELQLFLETAKETGPRHWATVTLLHSMGMRISEVAGLRVEGYTGYDEGAPRITFIEKGGNERTTPVPMPVLRVLELVRDGRDEGPMIPRRDGGQLSRSALPDPGDLKRPRQLATTARCRDETFPVRTPTPILDLADLQQQPDEPVALAAPVAGPVDEHGSGPHHLRTIPVRRTHRHRLEHSFEQVGLSVVSAALVR